MQALEHPVSAPAGPRRTARTGAGTGLLALTRPRQWPKNLLVVPLALLDTPVWSAGVLGRVCWSVAAFTVASALVYVVNDITDRHRDRLHPAKRLRPIAAGRVTVPLAWTFAAGLTGLLGCALLAGGPARWWPIGAYLLLNAGYGRRLKHVPLLEVFVVAMGFVLRIVQGYVATGARVSGWLLLCVFCLCLLLSLGKRRHELRTGGSAHRPALAGYSERFLDQLIMLTTAVTITAYLLYLSTGGALGPLGRAALFPTALCALFAVFRYLQTLAVEGGGGDPVRVLLTDRIMIITALSWAGALGAVALVARHPDLSHWLLTHTR